VNPDVTSQAPAGQKRELLVGRAVIHNEKNSARTNGRRSCCSPTNRRDGGKELEVGIDDFVLTRKIRTGT